MKALIGFLFPTPRSILDTYSQLMADRIAVKLRVLNPDLIIFSQISTALYADASIKIPTIFEEAELGLIQQNWSTQGSPVYRLRRKVNWWKVGRYINQLAHCFEACTVVSENERLLLLKFASGDMPIFVVPNGIDVGEYGVSLMQPEPDSLVFNGALTYNANYDAMRFFLGEVFSTVQELVPDVSLKITGSTQGVNLAGLRRNERVIFTGYLEDIRPVVASAWACIAPLRLGGGTRLKILEAMALGTPVITTSKGAEGLDVNPGRDILVADTPAEFAQKTVELLRNPGLRTDLANNARRLVMEKYGWDKIGNEFTRLVEETAKVCRFKNVRFSEN
jgi:glycosyltransferase involved in cell wall biosynthesis